MNDAELAAQLAATAGRILLQVRDCGLVAGQALGKTGDQTANQFLCHAIREQRPDDGLLSEEEKDNRERLSKSRVWIIDPVDGTREYGEARADWAVHVALAVDGVASVGAVALPGLNGGIVLRTDQPRPLPAARGTRRPACCLLPASCFLLPACCLLRPAAPCRALLCPAVPHLRPSLCPSFGATKSEATGR